MNATVALAGIDPGRNLGVALVSADGALLEAHVLTPGDLDRLVALARRANRVALGDGTGSAHVATALASAGIQFVVVDESGTSLEARALYFERNPARGLLRLLPAGLRLPPVPTDAYAAWAIALRVLHAGQPTPGAPPGQAGG